MQDTVAHSRNSQLLAFTALVMGALFALVLSATSQRSLLLADEAALLEAVPSENLCSGGLEDGKRIVHEIFLENHFKETTHLGCEVDGGKPVQMPDLPSPIAAPTRLV